jgi:hypothetical protein
MFLSKWCNWWQKNGHEMQGAVLNVLFIFLSSEHDKFVHLFGGDEFGIDRVKHWIPLLEQLVMMEEFPRKTLLSFKIGYPSF